MDDDHVQTIKEDFKQLSNLSIKKIFYSGGIFDLELRERVFFILIDLINSFRLSQMTLNLRRKYLGFLLKNR